MAVELALYQPDIPQNCGTMIRLAACLGVPVHVIHPTGFIFSPAALRRTLLDYADHAEIHEHDSFAHFEDWRAEARRRLVLLTTRAETALPDTGFQDDDVLMVGRESAGVPNPVAEAADLRVRIPMRQKTRSLNVATAASLVLGEALRQTGGWNKLG